MAVKLKKIGMTPENFPALKSVVLDKNIFIGINFSFRGIFHSEHQ